MEESKLELKSEVKDGLGNKLDSLIIGNIMTYLYGEPKSLAQIANYLNLSPVKLQIYLSYLIESGFIELFEQEKGEVIEKRYRFCKNKQNVDVNIKVDNKITLIQYADEMCANLRNSILSLEENDMSELSCYIGSVPEKALKGIINNIQSLQSEVEESEKEIVKGVNGKKYMLLTVFVPYEDVEK